MRSLDDVPNRTLALLGSIAAGGRAVQVLLGARRAPAAVALWDHTVYLDPASTTLGDLMLCGALLRHEREARGRDEVVPEVVIDWANAARERLFRELPGLRTLPGQFLHGHRVPVVGAHLPDRRPLELLGPGSGQASFKSEVAISGGRSDEVEDDFAAVVRALEQGRMALESRPELPELPMITSPIQLVTPAVAPADWEPQVASDRFLLAEARRIASCVSDKAQAQLTEATRPLRTRSGKRLDGSRLHELIASSHGGPPPRIFTRPRASWVRNWEPQRHLNVVVIDLNGLDCSVFGRPGTRLSRSLVEVLVLAVEHLRADSLVLGFADRLVDLADGRRVYVHSPVVIKRLDEPFDVVTHLRLKLALGLTQRTGRPTAFLPFMYQTAARHLIPAESMSHQTFMLFGLTPQNVTLQAEPEAQPYHRRVAQDTDKILDRISDRLPGAWSYWAYAPEALVEANKGRGWVGRMHVPGKA